MLFSNRSSLVRVLVRPWCWDTRDQHQDRVMWMAGDYSGKRKRTPHNSNDDGKPKVSARVQSSLENLFKLRKMCFAAVERVRVQAAKRNNSSSKVPLLPTFHCSQWFCSLSSICVERSVPPFRLLIYLRYGAQLKDEATESFLIYIWLSELNPWALAHWVIYLGLPAWSRLISLPGKALTPLIVNYPELVNQSIDPISCLKQIRPRWLHCEATAGHLHMKLLRHISCVLYGKSKCWIWKPCYSPLTQFKTVEEMRSDTIHHLDSSAAGWYFGRSSSWK